MLPIQFGARITFTIPTCRENFYREELAPYAPEKITLKGRSRRTKRTTFKVTAPQCSTFALASEDVDLLYFLLVQPDAEVKSVGVLNPNGNKRRNTKFLGPNDVRPAAMRTQPLPWEKVGVFFERPCGIAPLKIQPQVPPEEQLQPWEAF